MSERYPSPQEVRYRPPPLRLAFVVAFVDALAVAFVVGFLDGARVSRAPRRRAW
jgi:hypothetical protein